MTVAVKTSAIIVVRSQYCTFLLCGLSRPRRDLFMRLRRISASAAKSAFFAAVMSSDCLINFAASRARTRSWKEPMFGISDAISWRILKEAVSLGVGEAGRGANPGGGVTNLTDEGAGDASSSPMIGSPKVMRPEEEAGEASGFRKDSRMFMQ